MTPTDAQGAAPRCQCGHATHEGTCKAIVGKREGALSVTRYCGCTRAAPSLGTTTPDSGTYGELPWRIRALIPGHEWDNMTREEQRSWMIAKLASLTAAPADIGGLVDAFRDAVITAAQAGYQTFGVKVDAALASRRALDAAVASLTERAERLTEALTEAADELENDPKTRTCYNVAAALRAALSSPTPSRETNDVP
jgi:hypothetical protein